MNIEKLKLKEKSSIKEALATIENLRVRLGVVVD